VNQTCCIERGKVVTLRLMERKSHDGIAGPFRADAPEPAGRHRILPYLNAVLVTVVALGIGLLIETQLFVANVALVYLAAVVFCAARWGLWPALLACALSVVALNFFFFPPLHNLSVEDPENVVAVVTFVGVAVFVARLTARARANAALAERRSAVNEELYAFARSLTGIDDLERLLDAAAARIAAAVEVETVLLLANDEVLAIRGGMPPVSRLEPVDLAAAERCFAGHGGEASEAAASESGYEFLPLRAVSGPVGVIGIRRDGHPPTLTTDARRFIQAIIDQVAVAIERLTLADDVERARITAETEGLRSAMLSAISHDLKTPLASILGAATSLGSYNSYFEQQEREELVATIREEAERMSCFVANLLDITRVEAGTLDVQHEATDIGEVVGAAARRAKRILGTHRLTLGVAADLPMLNLDGVLLEQTLFNLLDNAAKYSPSQSTIAIEARRVNDRIVIKVLDEGPGIPPQDLKRIFEKFYRSGHRGRQRAGTGLGLAICRGFVEAMGGRIIAGNRTDRSGAVIMIGFPMPREPVVIQLPDDDDD
jgi:Osmosensitive K+ channel histidine kinase